MFCQWLQKCVKYNIKQSINLLQIVYNVWCYYAVDTLMACNAIGRHQVTKIFLKLNETSNRVHFHHDQHVIPNVLIRTRSLCIPLEPASSSTSSDIFASLNAIDPEEITVRSFTLPINSTGLCRGWENYHSDLFRTKPLYWRNLLQFLDPSLHRTAEHGKVYSVVCRFWPEFSN